MRYSYYLRIVRELLASSIPTLTLAISEAIGELIRVAILSVALTNMLGIGYAKSVVIAISVSAPTLGIGYLTGIIPYSMLGEAPVSKRRLEQLFSFIQTLLRMTAAPPIVALLLIAAASFGVIEWNAISFFNVIILSIPPVLISQGLRAVLERMRPYRILKLPGVMGPPSTLLELTSLLLDRLWIKTMTTVIYALSPIYFTLSSLPAWLRLPATILNPYALSIEVARKIITGISITPSDTTLLMLLSVAWFCIRMLLGVYY